MTVYTEYFDSGEAKFSVRKSQKDKYSFIMGTDFGNGRDCVLSDYGLVPYGFKSFDTALRIVRYRANKDSKRKNKLR